MKIKRLKLTPNLSDKISNALVIAPQPDIEDDLVFHTKPDIVTRGELSDSEDEYDISEFRRKSAKQLSEISDKYKGVVINKDDLDLSFSNSEDTDKEDHSENASQSDREELAGSGSYDGTGRLNPDDEEAMDYTEGNDDYTAHTSRSNNSDEEESESEGQSSENDDEESESEGESSENDDEDEEASEMVDPVREMLLQMSVKSAAQAVEQGKCVQNQLHMWEGLLHLRIHMQTCVNKANMMPLPDTYSDLQQRGGDQLAHATDKAVARTSKILNGPEEKSKNEKQIITDKEIFSDNEEIPSDEEIASDADDEEKRMQHEQTEEKPPKKKKTLSDYENEISQLHQALRPFRNSTIQKWNEKTRLITATAQKNTPVNSILNQIDFVLSDKNKLIRRTQLKRSQYDIIGYQHPSRELGDSEEVKTNQTKDRKDDDEYIPEIFDDSDFYHQMLRELIECKSADISDPVQLSRQWVTLQQMRSKMKRKVDTKATKGRKIKYVVHNQLVNFMAPDNTSTWPDETKNELYSSLFGKMFEGNVAT